jgi:hypothetical protein
MSDGPEYQFDVVFCGECDGEARVAITGRRVGEANPLHIDTINVYSATSRQRFCKAFARQAQDARAEWQAGHELLLVAEEARAKTSVRVTRQTRADELLAQVPQHVRKDAQGMLADPNLIAEIKDDIARMGVVGESRLSLGVYLIGVSRLLTKPLAGIARGATSSGKSHAVSTVAKLFPPESKLEAHHLSPKALYYLPEDALEHTFVVGGERARQQSDEAADATKPLREMLSDGVLRYIVTEQIDGRLQSIPFEKRGPIAFIESTSASTIFAEDANRCLILHADESQEQTQRIIRAAAEQAAASPIAVEELIVPVHHAMQRMLRPVGVVIPFAPFLADAFPMRRVEARRTMPHLLNTIRAVALLRQLQKDIVGNTVTADADDYAVALDIVRPSIDQLRGGIDEQVKRVWKAVEKHAGNGDEFTRGQAAGWAGMRESDSNGRLRVLAECGFITETQEAKGNRPARFRINLEHPDIDALEDVDLPSADDVRRRASP